MELVLVWLEEVQTLIIRPVYLLSTYFMMTLEYTLLIHTFSHNPTFSKVSIQEKFSTYDCDN